MRDARLEQAGDGGGCEADSYSRCATAHPVPTIHVVLESSSLSTHGPCVRFMPRMFRAWTQWDVVQQYAHVLSEESFYLLSSQDRFRAALLLLFFIQ